MFYIVQARKNDTTAKTIRSGKYYHFFKKEIDELTRDMPEISEKICMLDAIVFADLREQKAQAYYRKDLRQIVLNIYSKKEKMIAAFLHEVKHVEQLLKGPILDVIESEKEADSFALGIIRNHFIKKDKKYRKVEMELKRSIDSLNNENSFLYQFYKFQEQQRQFHASISD